MTILAVMAQVWHLVRVIGLVDLGRWYNAVVLLLLPFR